MPAASCTPKDLNKRQTSSLPPSSPPQPTSSATTSPSSPLFSHAAIVPTVRTPKSVGASLDDPFGFFAAERRLRSCAYATSTSVPGPSAPSAAQEATAALRELEPNVPSSMNLAARSNRVGEKRAHDDASVSRADAGRAGLSAEDEPESSHRTPKAARRTLQKENDSPTSPSPKKTRATRGAGPKRRNIPVKKRAHAAGDEAYEDEDLVAVNEEVRDLASHDVDIAKKRSPATAGRAPQAHRVLQSSRHVSVAGGRSSCGLTHALHSPAAYSCNNEGRKDSVSILV